MKRLFLLIPAMALMAACQREVPHGGNNREVEIRITTNATLNGAKTRAPGSEAEDAIKTVAVLVFDNSETPDNHEDAKFKRSTYAWEKSAGLYSAILAVGSDQDIYFAINADDAVASAIAGATEDVTPFSTIREALILISSGNNYSVDIVGDGLPMWGYRHNTSVTSEVGNSFGTVKVLRAVAAAEITVTDTNFEMTYGSVEYASKEGWLAYTVGENIEFGTGDNEEAPQLDYRLLAPEVPAGITTDHSIGGANITVTAITGGGQKIVDQLYFYENDKDETTSIEEKQYTKVVVGGLYGTDTEETYYPLAFRARNENEELINERAPIVRNTKYVFSVTKVNGRGFDTVEEAKKSEDYNMTYQVIEWNQWNDGDIVTWGTYWLSVGKSRNETALGTDGVMKTASLHRNPGSDDVISFTTNITDFKTFTIDGAIANHTFANTPTTANGKLRSGETLVKSIANQFYEIFLIEGTAAGTGANLEIPGRLLFVARQEYADRNDPATPNVNEADAVSTLTIGSGEIQYDIKVRQRSSAPEDWIDGGNQDWETGEEQGQ